MSVFLCLLLAAALLPASAVRAEEEPDFTVSGDESSAATVIDHLTVLNTTRMTGTFFLDAWGNVTSDDDVKALIHDYNLVRWDHNTGMFSANSFVVRSMTVYDSESGDRTYVLSLFDDLRYCDGSPITAWDYAFSILLEVSPEISQIGRADIRRWYAGYDEYASGEASCLTGVRVVSDHVIRITLDHEYLPFFYEVGLLDCEPYPIGEIAPGVAVKDDGHGVYLANADPSVTEPIFTAELLKQTILDPETGYATHPKVTSGPYRLVSFDGVTAEFEINPYFKTDEWGRTPTVQRLTYTLGNNETWIDQLVSGGADILNKAVREDVIISGLALSYDGIISTANYPRSGLSRICFSCELPTVNSVPVRQAIAWCTDRDAIVRGYTEGFGHRVDAYYGIGQWMYNVTDRLLVQEESEALSSQEEDDNLFSGQDDNLFSKEESDGEGADAEDTGAEDAALLAEAAAHFSESLTDYEADVSRAAALLEEAGWKLNADGLREKDGVVLDLKLMYPEGNRMGSLLEEHMVPYLKQAGIRLTLVPAPMEKVFEEYYRQDDRDVDMFLMATNFTPLSELSAYFESPEGTHTWSYTKCEDEELFNLSLDLRKTERGDYTSYMLKWFAFQERYNKCLPAVPLYSNYYFDFFRADLRDYDIANQVYWSEAVLGVYLNEETDAAAADE